MAPLAILVLLMARLVVAFFDIDLLYANRCFAEEIQKDIVVVVDYYVHHKSLSDAVVEASLKVLEPRGQVLHDFKPKQAGRFGFTTTRTGDYKFCFNVTDQHVAINTKVRLDIKQGVAAAEANVESEEDLQGLRKVLSRMEASARQVQAEVGKLKKLEESMRDKTERTHDRIASLNLLGIFSSIGMCVSLLWYTRTLFKRRKVL